MIALVCQINTIASVMMADISAAFPGASTVSVQYVMQSGMIGAFVISLIMSVLTSHFRKKPMILMGLAAIFIGGLLPILNHSSDVYKRQPIAILLCAAYMLLLYLSIIIYVMT